MFRASDNRWLVLVAVMLAFFPIVLDMTILHVAVPSLTLALQATATEVLWIIDIYPLLMASLLIPMGTLADRIGHGLLLLVGLTIFAVGSGVAAMSPSAGTLIGARAFMAVGSAMVMPCTLALVRQTFTDEKERALALGLWGAVASAGAAIGPLVGGALLEHFWWGSVFLVNVPLMLVVIPLVMAYTPRHAMIGRGKWNAGQALLLMIGLMATVYALKSAFGTGRLDSPGAALLLSGLALLATFVTKQLRSPQPMLDMALFTKPAISAGVLMAIVVMGSLAGVELMLAQELQFVLGRTPLEAGVFLLPLMIASAVGGPIAGVVLGAIGLRAVATLSLAVSAGCLAGLAFSNFKEDGLGVVTLLALLGLALSIGLTASSVAIMSSTPAEKAGSAGALEATSYDLGTGLGIAGFGLLLASSYEKTIRLPDVLSNAQEITASRSIGETMIAAQAMAGPARDALTAAARDAFSASHSTVLLTAAGLTGALGAVVFLVLRNLDTKEKMLPESLADR